MIIAAVILAKWLECSPMARETRVQSQVESYQKLKKWYLMLHCLKLSIVRIKGKVEQSRERSSTLPLHFGVVAIERGAFGSPTTLFFYSYLLDKQDSSLEHIPNRRHRCCFGILSAPPQSQFSIHPSNDHTRRTYQEVIFPSFSRTCHTR